MDKENKPENVHTMYPHLTYEFPIHGSITGLGCTNLNN